MKPLRFALLLKYTGMGTQTLSTVDSTEEGYWVQLKKETNEAILSWSKRLECFARQGQAEQLSKSRKKILATT